MTARPLPARRPFTRLTAGLLAFLVGFGPLTPLALAAPTPLADGPIAVQIKAKPNIVYTMDDSSSMLLNFLPDYVVVNPDNSRTKYCRGSTDLTECGSAGSATIPQFMFAEWGTPSGVNYPTSWGSGSDGRPAVMTAGFNAMFYNPAVNYIAPLKADGSSYPNMTAGNTTNWTQVPFDPYLYPAKFVNLQSKVGVGVWCNTDYADKTTNGDGTRISGDHCRINGWPYAAGANGAPKVGGDYNYPFAKVAADADNSRYFANNTKVLWCDPAKMNPTAPSSSCQDCGLACPVAKVNDPPDCDPGCTNPLECKVCTLKCPVAEVRPDDCGSKTCTTPPLVCGVKKRCVSSAAGVARACNTVIAAGPSAGKTYEQDANGLGDVCRRNNFTYGAEVAGGWTYKASHAVYRQSSNSCGSITSASLYRHYYKASVQWCNSRVSTSGNLKWRGFGDGTCQEQRTDTYKWPRYVALGSDLSAKAANETEGQEAFHLVELNFNGKKIIEKNGTPATEITHTLEDSSTITRGVATDDPETNELVNYANWYAYYRTRILAAKTVSSLAFSDLTDKFRVGYHTMSVAPATSAQFLTIDDFKGGAGGHREAWYAKLAGQTAPLGNATPTLNAVARIGEWFQSSTGSHPDLSSATNPITLSCQKNYHMLMTDGYTNQPAVPTVTVGNIDGAAIPALPEEVLELPTGGTWPNKIKEGATAVTDSLADYTLKFWLTDLRPDSFDKSVAENNVPTTENDPAKWQHLNFAALSLGTEGKLDSRNVPATEADIAAGTITWPTPSPVYRPGTAGVDDLWHAAVSGRSQFVNARDPAELQAGMAQILNEIKNLQAARSGAAFSNVNFLADDNFVYRVTIEPGYGGTLTKVKVDASTGKETAVITKYHEKLGAQVTPATVGDEPWFDDRRVVMWRPGAKDAKGFVHANLEADQLTALGASAELQKKMIAYLRGDRSNEGTKFKNFRVRPPLASGGSNVLGDIVNSSPVLVGNPSAPYADATDPGYEAFKGTSRKKMVYVGANDGMLHAFDEATGEEVFAYIPSFAFDTAADKGLKVLAKKDPFFKHQMFVDSTPVAADMDIGGTWKTMLIGGLGKGGKGYYGIDITDPDGVTDEDKAASRVKWEFTHSDLGYSYGRPLIGKLRAYGNKWVAIFSSGYNNSGKGKVFIVDPKDGTLLKTMETSAGSAGTPSGLGQLAGFVVDYHNQVIEQIYGGDLEGNLWRFDVSSASDADFKTELFAELTAPDGSVQAVTVAPQIEVDFSNGIDRWVFVGTGRLLDESDLENFGDQVQTMYALRDGTVIAMSTDLPKKPRTTAGIEELTDGVAGLGAVPEKGWFHDLPKGERIIAPVQAELNIVAYAGALPPENECLTGLASNIYAREFPNAKSIITDSGGNVVSSVYSSEGAVGMNIVNPYKESGGRRVADPSLAVTLGSDGRTIIYKLKPPPLAGSSRMSWRLLGQ